MQSWLRNRAVGFRFFKSIGGVDLDFDLDRFDWWPFQPQCLDAITTLRADAFDLKTSAERVGVVLERDHAHDRARSCLEHNDASF